MPVKEKRDWIPIILAVFALFFSICAYAYQQDMGYLRQSITEIKLNSKDTLDKYDQLEKRVDRIEIKIGD
jgi:hypothetical protein